MLCYYSRFSLNKINGDGHRFKISVFFRFSWWRTPPWHWKSRNLIGRGDLKGWGALSCQISSKLVHPLRRYCDFSRWWLSAILDLFGAIWTTHEEYLVIPAIVQYMLRTDASVSIILYYSFNIWRDWLENEYSPPPPKKKGVRGWERFNFLIRCSMKESHKRHILVWVRGVVWTINKLENPSSDLACIGKFLKKVLNKNGYISHITSPVEVFAPNLVQR